MKDDVKEKIEKKTLQAMQAIDEIKDLIYNEDYDVNQFDLELDLLKQCKNGLKKMLNNHFDKLARKKANELREKKFNLKKIKP
jgi:hypothetical protein